ncbi:MAG: methylmalonyl Co-A mutase-associated GTPase MeaB, partial [Rhodospirillales bacterium]|nr:methylmalonyl Co-A mutase-associated GTPase MeaB [Rhodospirillales bacterium]
DYAHALRLMQPIHADWQPGVVKCSALEGHGVPEVGEAVQRYRAARGEAGIARRRGEQARAWLWNEIGETLLASLRRHPDVKRSLAALERQVEAGTLAPSTAARRVLATFLGR